MRNDVFAQPRNGARSRITDYPLPASQGDGYSFGVVAMSRNGAHMLIGITSADTTAAGPVDGYFIYQRNTVFNAGFD